MADEEQQSVPGTPSSQGATAASSGTGAAAAPAAAITKADIEKNKVWAAISYFGLLGIIVALVCEGKDSLFVKFHLNQSLCLLIASLVAMVIIMIPIIGWILAPLIWLVTFIFMIMGIINAVQGQVKRLPLIGDFELIK